MNKMILTASLMSMLFFAGTALAVEAHHPATKDVSAVTQIKKDQTKMGQMDAQTRKMEEMRKKIEMEKDPAARQALMHEQMGMMKECMQMMEGMGMGMMGGKGMTGGKGMPMDARMNLMEGKMKLMQEMMNGMLMQQEMKAK